MPSPTSKSSAASQQFQLIARTLLRRADPEAAVRIRNARARIASCVATLFDVYRELAQIRAGLRSRAADRPGYRRVAVTNAATADEWSPGDHLELDGCCFTTDVETYLDEQIAELDDGPDAALNKAIHDFDFLATSDPQAAIEQDLGAALDRLSLELCNKLRSRAQGCSV